MEKMDLTERLKEIRSWMIGVADLREIPLRFRDADATPEASWEGEASDWTGFLNDAKALGAKCVVIEERRLRRDAIEVATEWLQTGEQTDEERKELRDILAPRKQGEV